MVICDARAVLLRIQIYFSLVFRVSDDKTFAFHINMSRDIFMDGRQLNGSSIGIKMMCSLFRYRLCFYRHEI